MFSSHPHAPPAAPVGGAFHDRVKILVLGDTGVGKTSLVHLLCTGQPDTNPQWTVGVNLEVLLHEHATSKQSYFVEFWDVSGQIRYARSRSVYYDHAQGVILVHDISNKKSYQHLKQWVRELGQFIDPESCYQWERGLDEDSYILELQYHNGKGRLPVLLVGNKADLATTSKKDLVDEEEGHRTIELSAMDPSILLPDNPLSRTMTRFYDKVIDTTFLKRDSMLYRKNSSNLNLRTDDMNRSPLKNPLPQIRRNPQDKHSPNLVRPHSSRIDDDGDFIAKPQRLNFFTSATSTSSLHQQ